jgi:hypothetical protein
MHWWKSITHLAPFLTLTGTRMNPSSSADVSSIKHPPSQAHVPPKSAGNASSWMCFRSSSAVSPGFKNTILDLVRASTHGDMMRQATEMMAGVLTTNSL